MFLNEQNASGVCMHDSLIPVEAGVGEGLDLDRWFCNFLARLGLYYGPLDALLQVDEAAGVAQGLGPDLRAPDPEGGPRAVGTHGVVDVHADGVAHFGREDWA